MHKQLPSAVLTLFCLIPWILSAQPKIQLQPFASGFIRPVDIAHCGDSRLFVVEQRGYIWVLDSLGNRLQDTFLNIDPRVRSSGNEQGLLGLAFPPDFAQTGYFYVNYTRETDGSTRVSRFSMKPGQPNQADPDSEVILFTQNQPYANHNGGCLKFGPDGYLYISLGDGGNGGDPQNYAQTKNTRLGKILRIDVNSASPGLEYSIPADNPFIDDSAFLPEIWSWGWRNPWRFSFDRLTGDMWVGDVGQNAREEIDFEPAHTGGRNYGWRCYEGKSTYSTSNCLAPNNYVPPVFDYINPSLGRSVTGGFVYRGSKYADLYGLYLFTDYVSGRWWATRRLPDSTFSTTQIADLTDNQYSSFGEDSYGELYVAALSSGIIYKVHERCSSFQIAGMVTDATCHGTFDGIIQLSVSGGEGPYTFNWSNDQTDSTIVYLNPGTYTVQAQDAQGCIRTQTFEVGAINQIATPAVDIPYWTAPLTEPALLCTGDTVLLVASEAPAGFGYQWYKDDQALPSGAQQQWPATQPGLYHVVFTGPGCSSPNSADALVAQAVIFVPEIVISGRAVLCPGDSTVLSTDAAPTGFSIQWLLDGVPLNGATGQGLTTETAGSYQVSYERAGCMPALSAPVNIQAETPIPNLGLVYTNDTLSINAGLWTSYQWYLDGAAIPGATGAAFVPLQVGFYSCAITSTNGCQYLPGLQVTALNTRLPDSVTGFTLMPNPTSGVVKLTLELQRSERVQLTLLDMQQRLIRSETLLGQRIEHQVDLSSVPPGAYYLAFQLESGSFMRAVVRK